ncbi:hypothetical protein C8R45DRAFT_1173961 [Mycena sanguinolenta]|nr:hypothetical protein C8R45DRAFT_1173961 [Mycena sanguinolenta]
MVLEAYVGPHENTDGFLSRFLNDHLVGFIQSLPPSAEVAELLPLICTIDPECIFVDSFTNIPERMLAWLKRMPSAPADLIKLWEDYECMVSFEETVQGHPLSATHIFPCRLKFLRILVARVIHQIRQYDGLSKLRGRLDLTWAEMRTSICGHSSNLATDELGLAVRLAFRDVALQCIRKMVKNQLDMGGQVYSWETRDTALESICTMGASQIDVSVTNEHIIEQDDLASAISYLVRLSPPCSVLYRELWCIPMDRNWLSRSLLIYYVSKWLESFPDPPTELITFWNQALGKLNWIPFDVHDLEYAENEWRDMVNRWNQTIVRLRLPDDLKLPLPI